MGDTANGGRRRPAAGPCRGNRPRTSASAVPDAEDDVERHDDRDDEQRQVEGGDGGGCAHRLDERAEAGLERAPQDEDDRHGDEDDEVAEGDARADRAAPGSRVLMRDSSSRRRAAAGVPAAGRRG